MTDDPSWAAATNRRAGIPYRDEMIAELDAENARLHGELIDVQCELATARERIKRLQAFVTALLDGIERLRSAIGSAA